jgi:hypothetical protein
VAGGFTVVPSVLQAGSSQLYRVRDDINKASGDVAGALIGAADACGNGQVQAALSSLAKTTIERFMDAMAGSQYTADGLAKAAMSSWPAAITRLRQRSALTSSRQPPHRRHWGWPLRR